MNRKNLRKLIINRLERKRGRGNIDLFSIEDVSDLPGKYSGIDWVVLFKVRCKCASEMHTVSAGWFRNTNDGPDLVNDFVVKDARVDCPNSPWTPHAPERADGINPPRSVRT
jgi:hypothetical protein